MVLSLQDIVREGGGWVVRSVTDRVRQNTSRLTIYGRCKLD